MARIIRVDVDTQMDFCDPEGALFVPADPSVLENIRRLVADAQEKGHVITGSVDSHAYDAWEFAENGGPFPAHCVKGTAGWLKAPGTLPRKFRFIPMSSGSLVRGENTEGGGNRTYFDFNAADEVLDDGVAIYFEKEVYSAFANPNAEEFIAEIVRALGEKGGEMDDVIFQVFGYCTGGYCVDAFALELQKRGYNVQVILDATAAIGGDDGLEKSRQSFELAELHVITTEEAINTVNW